MPAEERDRVLAASCGGDPELRAEVEGLLEADADPSGILGESVLAGPEDGGAPWPSCGRWEAGTRVGDFRILEVVGEGGMGTVYRAEQLEPVRREVAIKVLGWGMRSARGLARFENECQVLALMNHPNVARVYQVERAADVPFFVMEYVSGRPLTRFASERGLDVRARLALVVKVCAGVQHAHQKGIIHRDLKPANILVDDDSGEPKILDFGIARLADEHRRSGLRTLEGQVLGTLAYASPEQVAGEVGAIDTRTDVHALGVITYELLAGRLPRDLAGESLAGALRALEAEARPLGQVRPELAGDLEVIVSKALARDADQRYASAADLAADLQCFLQDEPVSARPPSSTYLLRKLIKRNKVLVAGVAAVLATVLVALVATARLASERKRALDELRAEQEARELTLARLRLRDLTRRIEDLWPVAPATVRRPGGIDEWLAAAERLQAELPRYRAELAGLRGVVERAPVRSGRRAELESRVRLTQRLLAEHVDSPLAVDSQQATLESRLVMYQRRLAIEEAALFEKPEEAVRYVAMCELTSGIPRLEPVVARVRERRRQAMDIERLTLVEPAAAWRAAIEAIRRTPRYGGLEIAPQLGLVPLGADPASGLQEFGFPLTGRLPERRADGALAIGDDTCLVFVLVPGGTFTMGAVRPGQGHEAGEPNVDPWGNARQESPLREVTLEPFFLSKYEMTQGQWLRVTGENPSQHHAGLGIAGEFRVTLAHPVESVSWRACRNWVSRLGLRLPTEAQWEYAARAGTATVWWTGNTKATLAGAANLADRTARRLGEARGVHLKYEDLLDDGHFVHAPVGSFGANAFGLHDVLGNVSEWTCDWYAPYTAQLRPGDGFNDRDAGPFCVARGGAFNESAVGQRSARRKRYLPESAYEGLGLRPARRLERGGEHDDGG